MKRFFTSRLAFLGLLAGLVLVIGDVACKKPGSGGERPGMNGGGRGGRGGGPRAGNEPDGRERREYAAPIGVITLERQTMKEYIETVGTVAPARSMPIKSEESGRIRFIKMWREGEYVEKGQILARLDEEETSRSIAMTRDDLEAQRKQLELALARLERNVADFDRAKVMFKGGQISRKAYEDREFQAESAAISYKETIIRVEKAEKELQQLLKGSERKVVRAPMTGYLVTASYVESRGNPTAAESSDSVTDMDGRLVGSGTTLGGVVDTTDVLIRCDVTSKDIAKVKKGQEVQAFVYSDGELEVHGDVVEVSPIMDVQTKAFKVDVEVSNEEELLRAGMFARVNIITQTKPDTLVLNRKVVQRRNNQDIVFVVGEESRAEKRIVQIGLENPDEVEILESALEGEGLRAGELLVTLGFETLQDKVRVKIVESDRPILADELAPSSGTSLSNGDGGTTRPAEQTGSPNGRSGKGPGGSRPPQS